MCGPPYERKGVGVSGVPLKCDRAEEPDLSAGYSQAASRVNPRGDFRD